MNRTLIAAALTLASLPALAQTDYSKVQIQTTKLNASTYMMMGAGGNLGVSAGPDGVLVIDDQFAPLSAKIKAAIAAVSDKPVKFVVNTHYHGDHTGGNENFMADGATTVAHDNVRVRMLAKPEAAKGAPALTYADGVSFHINGEEIEIHHLAPGHTDGDSIVVFKKGNVVHMGDLFFNGLYPYIDVDNGGSPEGVVADVDKVLAMIDDQTKVIPGHGPLATKADLKTYRDVVATINTRIKAMANKPLADVIAAKPTADFDAKWGNGFMKPAAYIETVWKSFQKK